MYGSPVPATSGLWQNALRSVCKNRLCGPASKWTGVSCVNIKDRQGFWVLCWGFQHRCYHGRECDHCCHSTWHCNISPGGPDCYSSALQGSPQSSPPRLSLLMQCPQPEKRVPFHRTEAACLKMKTWVSLSSLLWPVPSSGSGDPSLVCLDRWSNFFPLWNHRNLTMNKTSSVYFWFCILSISWGQRGSGEECAGQALRNWEHLQISKTVRAS